MPITLTPARGTAPRKILKGKLINELCVFTLDIPEATLRPLKQAFRHVSQYKVLEYFLFSSHTFLLALATPGASFGPLVGSKPVDARQLKAQFGEVYTTCNMSSYLKDIMKMADVDIDPFGEHDKPDA